jgi:hypothetical protein
MYLFLLIFYLFNFVNSHGNMNEKLMEHALNMHNEKRSNGTIVPAANMIKAQWDEFLEEEAQKLSDTCVYEHFVNGYGQNIYRTSNLDVNDAIHSGINAWYNEIEDYRVTILNTKDNKIGVGIYDHISQILWAESYKIGCSYSLCSFGIFLVCNYSPAGNFIGNEWFITGKQCSLCPSIFPFCENGLCTTPPPTQTTTQPLTTQPITTTTQLPTQLPTTTQPLTTQPLTTTTQPPTQLPSTTQPLTTQPITTTTQPTTQLPTIIPQPSNPCVINIPSNVLVQYIPVKVPTCVISENIPIKDVIDYIICKKNK